MKKFSGSLLSAGLILNSLTINSCQQVIQEVEQPNIIMFLVDDLGWQDTSEPFWDRLTALNRKYHTPNMERLAQQGVKFTQAYACSVCSPTRVSLMTGMNAAHHRVTNWTLMKDTQSVGNHSILDIPNWNVNGMSPVDSINNTIYATPLPQILKDNGYFTIHCGKAHLGAIGTPGADPLNLGFDINIAGHAAGAPGSYQGLNNYGNDSLGKPQNTWSVPGLEKYHGKDINLTEALTREAISKMDSALKVKQPFYLYMSHYGVHIPLQPDHRFYQKYKDKGYDEKEARYASMIESMDKSLGDLMDYIDEKKITENTIILFMSDNGGLSAVGRGGEPHTHNLPLSSGKGSAREGGTRVPMIVKWPGVTTAGSISEQYVIIEDFYPTILALAGIKNYETIQPIDGISFVKNLKNTKLIDTTRALFWHYPNRWGPEGPGIKATSTVVKGDWKLIYYHANLHFELFNLREDIGETINLAKQNSNKLTELSQVLGNYLRSVEAQMPTIKKDGKQVPWPDKI